MMGRGNALYLVPRGLRRRGGRGYGPVLLVGSGGGGGWWNLEMGGYYEGAGNWGFKRRYHYIASSYAQSTSQVRLTT
jgi:hypothetical protein